MFAKALVGVTLASGGEDRRLIFLGWDAGVVALIGLRIQVRMRNIGCSQLLAISRRAVGGSMCNCGLLEIS
jgi:hypothetical protein